ncbi:MAG: hypothetical protein M3256_19110 [Actinomycetota bacterium]|nr:hypothetical protein [Actinomycetota bacterium]
MHNRQSTVARDRPAASMARPKDSISARARQQAKPAALAPGGELAQIEGVGVTGETAVASQGETFGIAECRVDDGDSGGCGGGGHARLQV